MNEPTCPKCDRPMETDCVTPTGGDDVRQTLFCAECSEWWPWCSRCKQASASASGFRHGECEACHGWPRRGA